VLAPKFGTAVQEAHAEIDWSRGYTLLDKELQKVVRDAALGRRWADALIGVTGRDGQEDWVLVHVEVQGVGKPDFAQRMFVYNYRLYDRHGRPVVSLAVLGEPASGAFGEFGYQRWGCRMGLRFPVVSLSDWRARWAELDASANPFAVQQFDEEKRMRYVSSFERIAQRKGMEKGIGKGQARLLKLLIQQRFGPLPEAVDARLQTAAPEQLDAWALQVLDAASLEEVFGLSENH